ncbi:MAG: hypothetical protein H6605_10370 [Flavobacteriales bacterium]|nr:hypothetical protein [Flavobacteriales bacterium]
MKKILLISGMLAFFLWSCGDGGSGNDDKPTVKTTCDSSTYEVLVKPILTQHCNVTGCHSAGAGGIDLRTYLKAREETENGKLIQAINHQAGAEPMPQGAAKLSARELQIFDCWVTKGYPN